MNTTTAPATITTGQKVIVTVPLHKIEGTVLKVVEAPVSGKLSVHVEYVHPVSGHTIKTRYSERTDGLFRKSGDGKHAATLVFIQ